MDGRFSEALQRPCCRSAADVSLATVGEPLDAMLGVAIAPETVRTTVASHGRAMAPFQPEDAATGAAVRRAAGGVGWAPDAGTGNTREERWKDLTIAVISKRPAGTAATSDEWDTRLPPGATIVLTFAMIAASPVFRRTWRTLLRHLGVRAFAAVHALVAGRI